MYDEEANTAPAHPLRRWLVPTWLVAVLFAVVAGTAAFCWPRIASFDRSTIVLTNAHGRRVVAAVFTSRPPPPVMPAIVSIPPAATPPDATLAVTLELVRRGALVVVPDFKHSPRGLKRGPEGERLVNARVSDVEAILDYLESRKDVHRKRLG